MKKLLIYIITCLSILLLVGCDDKYEPVESTEEEARVIFTVEADGRKYEVRYELYRALFLGNKDIVDGGDSSVWQGEGAEEYINQINGIIMARATEIYSTIHLARELGYNPYSASADTKVREYVKGAVEGDGTQMGYGSYEAYLEALKKNNLNYSVADLLARYSLALEAVNAYYMGTGEDVFGNSDREFQPTKEAVSTYYMSDDSVRVLTAYIPRGVQDRAWVESFRNQMLSYDTELGMAGFIIGNTLATESDLIVDGELSGKVIGKDALDSFFYSEYIETAFSLEVGEMSPVIVIENSDADGYYILYKLDKSQEHLDRCYDAIEASYVDNVIGMKLAEIGEKFEKSAKITENYNSIIHSDISMG